MGLRARTYEIMENLRPDDRVGRIVNLTILVLILANVLVMILETVQSIRSTVLLPELLPGFTAAVAFDVFEGVSVVVFSLEYLVRLWSCTADSRYRHPLFGRLRFCLTPMALIDLLAVAPWYLTLFAPLYGLDMRFVRSLRMLRLLRIAKLARYLKALRTFQSVIRRKKEELVVTLFALMILLVLSSSCMYFIEHSEQPEVFSSIPASMWWAVTTLTTVGYGDVTPKSAFGQFVASVIAMLGVGLFALPAGILAGGFMEEFDERREPQSCPQCGFVLHPPGTPPPPTLHDPSHQPPPVDSTEL